MLANQRNRLQNAYTAIADEIRTLLKNDLRRQDRFENPKNIQFDFGDNTLSVDGHSYFQQAPAPFSKAVFPPVFWPLQQNNSTSNAPILYYKHN